MKAAHPVVIAFILLSGTCFAHQDRVITLQSDGALDGLPAEFQPASLHVAFSPIPAGAVEAIELDLGKNRIRLPLCVTGILLTERVDEIKVSASWYHDESIVPYYLAVTFFDPGYDQGIPFNPGYSLMFNLRTGKLMSMDVLIVRDQGWALQNLPIHVESQCRHEDVSQFLDGPTARHAGS